MRKSVRWPASSRSKQRKWWLPRNSHSNPYSRRIFHINSKEIDQRRGGLFSFSPVEAQIEEVKPDIIPFLRLMDSHDRWYYLSHLYTIKSSSYTCKLINEKNNGCKHLFLDRTTLKTLFDIYYSQLFDLINTS